MTWGTSSGQATEAAPFPLLEIKFIANNTFFVIYSNHGQAALEHQNETGLRQT